MALIKCPECGKEISDKASACIHCGFPISQTKNMGNAETFTVTNVNEYKSSQCDQTRFYALLFHKFASKKQYEKYRIPISGVITRLLGRDYPEANSVNRNAEHMVFDGITYDTAVKMMEKLREYGCITEVYTSNATQLSPVEGKILDYLEYNKVLRCPRCHSTAVTTGARGFSMVSGFLGSGKTVNRCGQCGYTWKP